MILDTRPTGRSRMCRVHPTRQASASAEGTLAATLRLLPPVISLMRTAEVVTTLMRTREAKAEAKTMAVVTTLMRTREAKAEAKTMAVVITLMRTREAKA